MPSSGPTPIFDGRYSDGTSAAVQVADVRFADRGLEILPANSRERLIWPYRALASAEPLSAHSIDAIVTYAYQPDATLFVAGPEFARTLPRYAPHLTARAERLKHATPWLWLTAAIVIVWAAVWLLGLSPARTIAGLLPERARIALGKQTINSMTVQRPVCDRAGGSAALHDLTGRLSAATGSGKRFSVIVIDWDLMNAFAVPGDRIALTRGLLEKAEGPDEIAGVLAHEMGHGLELHPETGLVRAMGLSAAMELLLGGGSGAVANFGLMLVQLAYTRDAEREADEHAVEILKEARISLQGLSDFFSRTADSEGAARSDGKSSFVSLLSTHPLTAERIARIKAEPSYPAVPSLAEDQWAALKAICPQSAAPAR